MGQASAGYAARGYYLPGNGESVTQVIPRKRPDGAQERLPNRYDWDHTADLLEVLLRGAEAWFRRTILPHLERQHSRTLWRLTHRTLKAPGAPRTAAGAVPPGGERAYPAGKRLPPKAAAESVTHAPIDGDSKKAFCWGAITHCGCQRSADECDHSHRPFKGSLAQQHWTVQAQLIRQGGLKNERAIPPGEVDGRIKQLRDAARAEAAAKVAEGAARGAARRASGEAPRDVGAGDSGPLRVHWAPPEELTTFAPTAAELELSEALKGPSAPWTTDAHPVEAGTPRAEFDAQ